MTNNQQHAATMSGIHDSTTCALGSDGGPCDWCRNINERERQVTRLDSSIARRILTAIAEDGRYASFTVIGYAIDDVIDAGWNGRPWHFDPDDESEAQTEHRYAFRCAVLAAITQLQSPPHGMDAGLKKFSPSPSVCFECGLSPCADNCGQKG
jgi:hypothetical protein